MIRLLFCVWVATSLATPATAATPPTLGTITQATGQVERADPAGNEAGIASGEPVFRGTLFTTGVDGNVEIELAGGSVMRIRPNSSLQLSPTKRRRKKKNSVVLFFGRVWSRVSSAIGGERNYEVNTPTAVAGVRGTEFETAVGNDGSVRIRVDEGHVAVADEGKSRDVKRGQRVDADVGGLGKTARAQQQPNWERWDAQRTRRVKRRGPEVMRSMKSRLERRQAKLDALQTRRKELTAQLPRWEREMRLGDPEASAKIREINEEIANIDDDIADLSDVTRSQFGYVNHLVELAEDPRFGMIGADDIKREAKTLLKLKRQFDAFEAEGRDSTAEGMDRMMEDFRDGKRETLKDKKGSVKDIFGDD